MNIPMNNGKSITPIYIPQPVVSTNSGVIEQSNTNTQNNEPTLWDWIMLGVVLILLITFVVYFIKLLKDFFGSEE